MPSLLYALSYLAILAAFVFVTLSLASGLLWLAEVIEENSKLSKTIGIRITYAVIVLHVALYFADNLPLNLIALSIVSHLVYLQNFSATWPVISLSSWSFLASVCLVVADHFLWFFHFTHQVNEFRRRGGPNRPPHHHTPQSLKHQLSFTEIASFFGICIWLVPLYLFLSLSANDNALPVTGDASHPSTPKMQVDFGHSGGKPLVSTAPRQSLFKWIFDPIFDVLALLRIRRRPRSSEGIIAPRTPTRSPLLTPTGNGFGFSDSQSPVWEEHKGHSPALKLRQPPPRRVTSDGSTSSPIQNGDVADDVSLGPNMRVRMGKSPTGALGLRTSSSNSSLNRM
ncbi:hypothetical protein FRC03_011906 [Tulasnella sp. 419]|nr:hypothetical protein FRC02_001813 [Tulasnella sp. 418]KAG8953174.1 hypothetical protein FRC03_011906 [Tulasnella sp. 419]